MVYAIRNSFQWAWLFACCVVASESAANGPDSFKIELSFGQSQMYIDKSLRIETRQNDMVVLPTNSALFIAEFFFKPRVGGMFVFNLPLETQKTIVNNVIKEEKASSYIGLGARWSPYVVTLFQKVNFEAQLGALAGPMIKEDWSVRFVPVGAGRLLVSSNDGFTMYFGGFYTLGINAPSVIYGVGHRF